MEFSCRNKACISVELVCNGEDNCHDCDDNRFCVSSDEAHCSDKCDKNQVSRTSEIGYLTETNLPALFFVLNHLHV